MSRPARTRRSSSDLRGLLIEAAGDVFASKPYSEITAEEIAAEAGVTRSVMYRHFENKADLFRAAVLTPFVASLRQYGATWRAQSEDHWDELRLMRAMVAIFYDSFVKHGRAVLALADMDPDPELLEQADAALEEFYAEMRVIAEEEQRLRGWIATDQLELSVRLIIGSVASAAVMDRLFLPTGEGRPDRDAVIDRLAELGLYGLRLRPSDSG